MARSRLFSASLIAAAAIGAFQSAGAQAKSDPNAQAPVRISPPGLTLSAEPGSLGTPEYRLGFAVTANPGQWNGAPNITWEWKRCNAGGNLCNTIPGETTARHAFTSADVGFYLQAVIRASNAVGSATASVTTPRIEPGTLTAPQLLSPSSLRLLDARGMTGYGSSYVVVGNQFTSERGRWNPVPAATLLRWERCTSPSATGCTAIPGTTDISYQMTAADVNSYIRYVVTASNAAGSTTVPSNFSSLVQPGQMPKPAPPSQSPFIQVPRTGFTVGTALQASGGTWGTGIAPTIAWERCQATAEVCSPIGQQGSSYSLTLADVGSRVRVAASVSNVAGTTTAYSTISSPIVPSTAIEKPRLLDRDLVLRPLRGDGVSVGSAIRGAVGNWSGSPTFTYAWQSCRPTGEACVAVAGQTTTDYTITAADRNRTLRFVVTASNAAGSTTFTSTQGPLIP